MIGAPEQQDAPQDALSHALTELQTVRDEFSGLYYAVSHDLCAPVRSIVGFSKALEEDFGEQILPAQKDYLCRIVRNAAKLESMIETLLSLSRIAQTPISIEPVDLSRLVLDTVNNYKREAPERSVRTIVENRVVLNTDSRLIRRVIERLIDNAWKFSRDDRPLEIIFGIDRTAPAISCYVRDNGIGFDMSFADRLFTPFQKLHSESRFSGFGVGLATVHRIIRHMGGKVWVDAEPNRGATFYFSLPPVWGNTRGMA